MLVLQSSYPYCLVGTVKFRLGLFGQSQEVVSMRHSGPFQFSARSQPLQPKLADRLKHHEARLLGFLLRLLEQALVNERGHGIQHWPHFISKSSANRLYCFQCAPTCKDGEPSEESLFLCIEQVVAPFDSIAEVLLSCWYIAYSTR